MSFSALLIASIAVGIYLWHSRPRHTRNTSTTSLATVTVSIRLRQHQLPVLDAQTLLAQAGVQGSLRNIQTSAGLSQSCFDQDMWPVLLKVAEFVQRLPASESHHHAHPGGLLLHLIEVTDAALRMRRGVMLPRGAAIEEVDRLRHRWTVGVFLAALLHDIGKPLADLRIMYFVHPDASPLPWTALSGSLLDHHALAYSVQFPESAERDYSSHRRLAGVLMQQIVPRKTLLWLGEDPQLMQELSAYLSGESLPHSAIAELVTAADRESVANNLHAGSRTRFKSARATPLIERLMEALRRMLVDGTLTLNQSGFTAGWVQDGAVWLIPKTVADAVRNYLQQHDTTPTGIPTDNNRLFDTWQEYGAIVINPVNNHAIWDILVQSDDATAEPKSFNALRFPLDKLFASAEHYPVPYQGSIQIQASKAKVALASSIPVAATSALENTTPVPLPDMALIKTGMLAPQDAGAARVMQEDAGAMVEPEQTETTVPAVPKMKTQSSLKQLLHSLPTGSDELIGVTKIDTALMSATILSDQPLARIDPYAAELATLAQTDTALANVNILANRFISWIQQSVERGALPFNRAGSPLHFVDEGMLLVSPAIFKQFQREHGSDGAGSGQDDPRGYLQVQSAVIKSGWAVASGKKDYLHTFVVDNVNKPTKPKLICLLLADPTRWFSTIPPSNPVLRRYNALLDNPLDQSQES